MTSAKFLGFWTPSPPFVTHSRNLSVVFVTYWVTPLPPRCGRHISIAPNMEEEGPLRSGVAADSAERGRPSRRVINFEAGDRRGDKQVEAGI